jgi:regulator of protease activity HflC (stomatin/prohibitin superfamily)
VCSQYTAEELIAKRAESSDKMRDELNEKLDPIGITVTDFNIIDFDFSEEFINAVEAKQVAEQVKKKAATENETAIAQAEREKQVSIKQAEADAEKVRIEAEANANAVKLAAEAEAYRLQQINENLTDKTILNTIAEHWDGILPKIFGGSTASILDVNSIFTESTPTPHETGFEE